MTKQALIRVVVVDDHDAMRRGLNLVLQTFDDLELVGEAVNGEEALALCADCAPDVVLMDLVMPNHDGVTATRAIRTRFPDVQVVALTSFHEHELIQAALQAGAAAYLIKDVSIDVLASTIRAVVARKPDGPPETPDRA